MNKIDTNKSIKEISYNGVVVPFVSSGGDSSGKYLVQVIDYDGTVLKSEYLNTGATFDLPNKPTHDGLIFQNWSSPVDIGWTTISTPIGIPPIEIGEITVEDSDITIGATYTTASGLSEFDIELTKVTGLDVTFNMVGNKNWGDGTTDSETTHTYADYGKYTITCDGTEVPEFVIGQSNSVNNYTLTNVRLGSNVTNIGNNVFKYCYSLTNITLPNSVTTIGANAFNSCYSLVSIVIPNSVTTIKDNTFYYCSSLTSAAIPNSVTTIGASGGGVFFNCNSLTSITIPNSVTSISGGAFNGCYSLTNVNIPSGVTSIGTRAFQNCNSLTSITIPSGVKSISNGTFNGCYSLTNVNIPSGVTSIGNGTFNGCYSLTNVNIPSGVKSISGNAFQNCNSLTSITIPNSVTSIGGNAFQNCYSLTNVNIPNSVTSISIYTFQNCYSIIKYDFTNATKVPTLSNINAFTNINQIAKIIVPDALYDSWIAATNWATYANYIYKASEVEA